MAQIGRLVSVFLLLLTAITPAPAQTVTIDAVGDVLLDRGVAAQVRQLGYGYPFAHVQSTLSTADIAFANLECPLTTRGKPIRKLVTFKADPRMAECLALGGIDIVSTANNHSMDCGRAGLVETMASLQNKGIAWCGSGSTPTLALTPRIISVRGIRVAFVGFTDFAPEGIDLHSDHASLAMATDGNVKTTIAEARRRADVVVASFHWGIEYHDLPTDRQRHLAHLAATCGADLVLGHHPHVTQGVEVVHTGKRTCLIDYSLGNFVFDTHLTHNEEPESTIILKVAVDRMGLKSASFVPIVIHQCAPSLAKGVEAKAIDLRVSRLSRELGTQVVDGDFNLAEGQQP